MVIITEIAVFKIAFGREAGPHSHYNPLTGGSDEQQRGHWPVGILEATPSPHERSSQRLNRLVLPDHTLLEQTWLGGGRGRGRHLSNKSIGTPYGLKTTSPVLSVSAPMGPMGPESLY